MAATGRSRLIEQSMTALAPIMSASAFHSHWPDMDACCRNKTLVFWIGPL